MSLFDLQDVCIAIGSLATLDLPMVVDLIGIYVLKGPYCTLTTTKWFLQALSVIPRGSWGDVSRRFTMIRWANRSDQIVDRIYDEVKPPSWPPPFPLHNTSRPPPAAASRDRTCSDHLFEEIPFVSNSSALLVQTDEGVLIPVVDRIKEIYRRLPLSAEFPVNLVGARRLDASMLQDIQVTKMDRQEPQLVDPHFLESLLLFYYVLIQGMP
ncbi:sphingoid long-chain bases kinase 2, mitochondrial [Dorcoceras hygrometricum]|uniref:Sphingoid long-chain bases kinase 2, mitochondrial n=1 Tax=Dorcoceras hygrometricum TaxID=472368 RepID=A0A2Z7BDM9_9LAMI|nr:sphingoid long-chain bases kinase 2, mitochondrial [Dorcoceras hygrometricum]